MKKDMIKVYALIITGIVIISVVGTTFAFFSLGVVNEGASGVTYELTDQATLTFEKGTELVIDASLENFSVNGGNLSSTTTAKVTLDATENYTADYYVYFQINSNDFVYTTEDETAELVLKITGPNGEVKSIDGLDYVTSGGVSGFDVTTLNEYLIEIATPEWLTLNYSASNTSTSNDWTFTLYLINLDTNQNDNSGKTFDSEVVITTANYIMPTSLTNKILLNSTNEETVEDAIVSIESKTNPIFSTVANTNMGLYATEDDYGTSYYYRGAVDNNWLYFGGYYWRIVRIDGAGNIKLIYTGEDAPTSTESVVMTGVKTQLNSTTYYNNSCTASYCVGYMYTYGVWRGSTTNSTVKTEVDKWYEENLIEYQDYLADTVYCTDRTSYSNTSGTTINSAYVNGSSQYYGSYMRTYSTSSSYAYTPTLKCSDKNDAYTVDDVINGNGELSYPIGLLSADEASFAGMTTVTTTYGVLNYLYTNQYYWLLSPSRTASTTARVFTIHSSGYLNYSSYTTGLYGMRPTISLDSKTRITIGDGTWDNPYIIE